MSMIETSLGPMGEHQLDPFTEVDDNEDRTITKTGYRYQGETVQQDVLIVYKKIPEFNIVGDLKL